MKYASVILIFAVFSLVVGAFPVDRTPYIGIKKILINCKKASFDFYQSTIRLSETLQLLDSTNPASVQVAKNALKKCRIQYKKISFFLDYFFPDQAMFFNSPAKFEVEEPYQEFEGPHGLQEIESLLFRLHPLRQKKGIIEQMDVIRETAQGLPDLLNNVKPTGKELRESIHLELIRMMCLYISGYDAPLLQSGIQESQAFLEAFKDNLRYLPDSTGSDNIKILRSLNQSLNYIRTHSGFINFDRLTFLSTCALPLEEAEAGKNLLKGELFESIPNSNHKIIALGKKLFSEKMLSGDGSRSCASCHQPGRYFTDGLLRNRSVDRQKLLLRNTPTLIYAAFQSAQFWDGRVRTPAEQINTVLTSPLEMNAIPGEIENKLNGEENYKAAFHEAFHLNTKDRVSMGLVTKALGAYLRTLAPRNSAFDQYFRGNRKALTLSEKKGFNLFMGKGQCGSCHFLPVFNGSIPPHFNRSEYEVLGIPATDNLTQPKPDSDAGRYSFFPSPFYQSAFKTPTVRNISRTAPYMHNGSFSSLEKVLDFYNRGGGIGIGMALSNQTLSEAPLHLTKTEQRQIILFLRSLTDKLP